MEKGINQYFLEKFGIEQADIRSYSPLVLAYIGDGIYDLAIRSLMVGKGNAHVNDLHKKTSRLVKAHAQSEMIGLLQTELTEEERAIPAGQKCKIIYYGKKCVRGRLPQGDRL